MKKFRGFNLKKRVLKIFRRNSSVSGYHRLESPSTWKSKPMSRLFSCLKTKAKSLCCSKNLGRLTFPSYVPLCPNQIQEKDMTVPKGHMAVYVGQNDGDFHRVLVPVIYFNHPLFGELLREAEEEYGFNHLGGITIPCGISEFESIQTRIAAARRCRKLLRWKKSH